MSTRSSPSSKRRLFNPEIPKTVVPIIETNNASYSTYNQVMAMAPPLISMPPLVDYTPAPHFPEFDDAAFTGVDMFLLDQFSNLSNPLDFDSFDFNSTWLGGEGVTATNFGVAEGWSNQFRGAQAGQAWRSG